MKESANFPTSQLTCPQEDDRSKVNNASQLHTQLHENVLERGCEHCSVNRGQHSTLVWVSIRISVS